jgi:hypothetical protein
MTTVIPFIPSNIKPYSFPVTLDGNTYSVTVTWNVSAQRFYINVYDRSGAWIVTVPLITTPPNRKIESVNYNPFQLVLEVIMVSPTLWPIPLSPGGLSTSPGTIIDYTLEGFNPTTYNGKFRGMHVNGNMFTVPMATNPGSLIVMGAVSRKLNMIAGVFTTSTLIYRNGSFEIDP